MLLRRIARPLLAAPFVVDGIDVLINPEPRAKKLMELESQAENSLSGKLPSDATGLVRIAAASQISGAVLLTLGKIPRIGAAILAVNVIPALVTEQDFWAEDDPARRSAKRTGFLSHTALLGGLMIAAADTEGKPSLGWRGRRAAHGASAVFSTALSTGDNDRIRETADTARGLAGRALTEAADLTTAAREHAPQWADAAKGHAAHLTHTVREHGPEWAEATGRNAAHLTHAVREHAPEWAEATGHRAANLTDRLTTLARESAPVLAENVKACGGDLARATRHRGRTHAR